jgi:hypothetical protein
MVAFNNSSNRDVLKNFIKVVLIMDILNVVAFKTLLNTNSMFENFFGEAIF